MENSSLGRCIGLVGGLGVGAAVHYYQELAKMHTERGRVLNLVMVHADNLRVRRAMDVADKPSLAAYLAELIGRLKSAGAEFAVVPAVAPHMAIDKLVEISPLPMVSMIAEVRRELEARRLTRVALLGTRYVIESRLYGQLENIEMVMPQPDEIDYIHTTYFQIVDAGAGTAAQRDGLTRLAHTFIERDRAEAIVLAGTDLALVFNETNTDFPHVDAARVHLDAIAQRAFA
jgi:aspartate racemase